MRHRDDGQRDADHGRNIIAPQSRRIDDDLGSYYAFICYYLFDLIVADSDSNYACIEHKLRAATLRACRKRIG